MTNRPEALSERYARRFEDLSVVARYHLRPTYPPETFAILNELIQDEPRVVLDVGCGTGNIARRLTAYTEEIDAVDMSEAMLECARKMPGGDSKKISWLHGQAEKVNARPNYALITAGESLHWMDWEVALPRFAQLLSPHGVLAIVTLSEKPRVPWQDGYVQIVKQFSNNPTYVPIDLSAELQKLKLFQPLGQRTTMPVLMRQTIEDYISAQHARSALSLDTMTADGAAQFDGEMYRLLSQYALDGYLTLSVVGEIIWGKPLSAK